MHNAFRSLKNEKPPWGYIPHIMKDAKMDVLLVTRNIITFAFKKFCLKKDLEKEELDSPTHILKMNKSCKEKAKISLKTIRNFTKSVVPSHGGWETLMKQVEPYLVTLILALAQVQRWVRASECISLANDLISILREKKRG